MTVDRTDVIIVGGGVIGMASAWQLARAGRTVTVVDPEPGNGASWVAAGMLAPVSEVEFGDEDLAPLLLAGAASWPQFASELTEATGLDIAYRRCGTVVVAFDASDREVIDRSGDFRRRLGLTCERLSPRECRTMIPALGTNVRGGLSVPGDHQVDNRLLLAALRKAGTSAGVNFVREDVVELEIDGALGVKGVVLRSGLTLSSDAVVVATGADTARLEWLPVSVSSTVRPVKGHILRLQGHPENPLLPCTLRGLVRGRSCYLVPRKDGSIVLGATSEELGFDEAVRVGPVHMLLDDARLLVPGLDELELLECRTGFRPGSPACAPSVGWTETKGMALAAGHYRNGILLAPLTAAALVALLTGNTPLGPMADCAPVPVGANGPAA